MFSFSDLSIINPPIEDIHPKKIIYYQGTFDPVHEGHLSALTTTMDVTKAEIAIVVADDGENPFKPKRTSWELRTEMIRIAFSHLKNVYISTLPKNELKTKLCERAHVTLLIGSDVWPFYRNKKEIPFPSICVCVRASELITSLALENKEVISIQSPIQGCSSTKIRKYLKLHPELYQVNDTSSLENTSLNTLDRRVLNYILTSTQKPYYRSKEQHVRRVKEKVKEYVSSHVFKNEMMQLVCLNDIGEGGKSGNLTFKVTSEREKYFIKAFVNSEHLRDFANELGGIRLLNSLSLSSCRAVDSVCWEQSKSGYSHAGLPYVEKKDLAKIFKALHCQHSEDVSGNEALIEMCFYMGQALSEFHHCRSYPVQSYRLKEETQKINQRAQSCLDQIPNNDERLKLREAFFDSYNQFLEQPGVHTYAHGDANASNFIVDLEAKKVTFIDLDRFFSMRTKEGDPLGFPGEDYHRFYQGLSWLNHFYPIASSTLQSAKEAFERGYHHRFNSLITIQAHTYFSAYWKLRVLSAQQSG